MSVYVFLVSILLFPSAANAYIDPGTGSLLVTTVLGLIAAVGFTLRAYLDKLKGLIRRKDTREDQDEKQ